MTGDGGAAALGGGRAERDATPPRAASLAPDPSGPGPCVPFFKNATGASAAREDASRVFVVILRNVFIYFVCTPDICG